MADDIPMPAPYAPAITAAEWADATKTTIRATIDGVECAVPTDPGNRHYAAMLAAGTVIADPPATTGATGATGGTSAPT